MSTVRSAKMVGTLSQPQRATRAFSTGETGAGAARTERAPKARVERTASDLEKSIFVKGVW